MSKKFQYIILFILINFGALAIGTYLMDNGPTSNWYLSLNKAPWTPPGWVFGVAWFSIMVCFSVYMANLVLRSKATQYVLVLFGVQFVFNISWNYIFFNQHLTQFGFVNILLLTFIVGYFLISFKNTLKLSSLWIVPYFIWLLLASSLNLYIILYN